MADGKTEGGQPTTDRKESTTEQETVEATVPTVASSLAGMFLEHQIRKGRVIEIPSLKIRIKVEKAKPESMNSKEHGKGKEEPPKHTGSSTEEE